MQQLDLDAVHAGMVLGEDAFNAKGQLLLRAGTVLSARHLQMLRANAIARLRAGAAEAATPHGSWHSVIDIDTHIETRFGLCDNQHPLVRELRRLCRQRLDEAHGGSNDD